MTPMLRNLISWSFSFQLCLSAAVQQQPKKEYESTEMAHNAKLSTVLNSGTPNSRIKVNDQLPQLDMSESSGKFNRRGFGLQSKAIIGDPKSAMLELYGDEWCGNETLPYLYDRQGKFHGADSPFSLDTYSDEVEKASPAELFSMTVNAIEAVYNLTTVDQMCNYTFTDLAKRDLEPQVKNKDHYEPPEPEKVASSNRGAGSLNAQILGNPAVMAVYKANCVVGVCGAFTIHWYANVVNHTPPWESLRAWVIPFFSIVGIADTCTWLTEGFQHYGTISKRAAKFIGIHMSTAATVARKAQEEANKQQQCPSIDAIKDLAAKEPDLSKEEWDKLLPPSLKDILQKPDDRRDRNQCPSALTTIQEEAQPGLGSGTPPQFDDGKPRPKQTLDDWQL